MRQHPANLALAAALWSLRAARQHLATAAGAADHEHGIALTETADSLGSQSYGNRRALGHHSDPTAGAALNGTQAVTTSHRLTSRLEQLADSTTATLQWLADRLHPGTGDPLHRLQAAAPNLRPATAVTATRHIRWQDQQIRRALSLDLDRQLLVGMECPACLVRQVHVDASAPDRVDWTVSCGAGCACTGPGCPCGMPVKAVGFGHIWIAASVLAERPGATLAA